MATVPPPPLTSQDDPPSTSAPHSAAAPKLVFGAPLGRPLGVEKPKPTNQRKPIYLGGKDAGAAADADAIAAVLAARGGSVSTGAAADAEKKSPEMAVSDMPVKPPRSYSGAKDHSLAQTRGRRARRPAPVVAEALADRMAARSLASRKQAAVSVRHHMGMHPHQMMYGGLPGPWTGVHTEERLPPEVAAAGGGGWEMSDYVAARAVQASQTARVAAHDADVDAAETPDGWTVLPPNDPRIPHEVARSMAARSLAACKQPAVSARHHMEMHPHQMTHGGLPVPRTGVHVRAEERPPPEVAADVDAAETPDGWTVLPSDDPRIQIAAAAGVGAGAAAAEPTREDATLRAALGQGLDPAATPRPRLSWTAELHDAFVVAVTMLGGATQARPRAIHELMQTPGLTVEHVKSHLQARAAGGGGRETPRPRRLRVALSLSLVLSPPTTTSLPRPLSQKYRLRAHKSLTGVIKSGRRRQGKGARGQGRHAAQEAPARAAQPPDRATGGGAAAPRGGGHGGREDPGGARPSAARAPPPPSVAPPTGFPAAPREGGHGGRRPGDRDSEPVRWRESGGRGEGAAGGGGVEPPEPGPPLDVAAVAAAMAAAAAAAAAAATAGSTTAGGGAWWEAPRDADAGGAPTAPCARGSGKAAIASIIGRAARAAAEALRTQIAESAAGGSEASGVEAHRSDGRAPAGAGGPAGSAGSAEQADCPGGAAAEGGAVPPPAVRLDLLWQTLQRVGREQEAQGWSGPHVVAEGADGAPSAGAAGADGASAPAGAASAAGGDPSSPAAAPAGRPMGAGSSLAAQAALQRNAVV